MQLKMAYVAALLVGLAGLFSLACHRDPHPTHPIKVHCAVTVHAVFDARVDHSTNDPLRGGEDDCSRGVSLTVIWDQVERVGLPFCVATGTSAADAATYCIDYLNSLGYTVGSAGPEVDGFYTGSGRVCPGSQFLQSQSIVSRTETPDLGPDICREGDTWPLRPVR